MALVAALACVVANAFFVAAEFALARVRRTALEARARAGDQRAARAMQVLDRLDAYLTATQFGITLASLGLGWLGEPAIAHFVRPPLAAMGFGTGVVHGVATVAAFTTISVLHIVVGELMPKSLAILEPENVSRYTARPMMWFFQLMFPFLFVLNGLSNYLLRRVGVEGEVTDKHSAEEIRLIVQSSFADEAGAATKRDLLERVLRATDRPARALMVPRVDMYSLSLTQSLDEWLGEVRTSGFSRYPVTRDGDPDAVVGYVYVKDLLLAKEPPRRGLAALARDVLFVPEATPVGELLAKFQQSNIPLAIVVDEYGGTRGLVTVEDVVEELVGELQDELDEPAPTLEQREDGTLIAPGTLSVGDLPLLELDEATRASGDTLSAYFIARLGRLAHPGDRLQIGGYEATVEDVRRRRIQRVALRAREATIPPPAGEKAG